MNRQTQRTWGAAVLALTLLLAGALPAAAQGDDFAYTVVGGKDEPQSYPDQQVNGYSFTGMTYRSRYPAGLEFRVIITPPEGTTIERVILYYTFATGKGGRITARPGDAPNEWIAIPYEGRGLPPWHEVDARWVVRGTPTDAETAPVHAVYYDPTREWYRAESEDILVYWYGMPVELGRYVLDAMAQNRARYLEGFGAPLPYRPLAVIFPPGPAWLEYRTDSGLDDTQLGYTGTTIQEAGSTIQRVRTLEPAEIRKNCIWNPENPTVEFQMQQAASTTTHEVAHLYQQELGVLRGPDWWVEGQAMFFETFAEYPVHERLSTLAELRGGDFPTLQGTGPGGGALTAAEDGCTHLIYDMGASFMTWLVETHGGMDTYRAIVEAMRGGYTVAEALEKATGQPFLELENQWRAFLGIPPVPAEVLDPALGLGEPAEPYFRVGEQVTLPAMPFSRPLYTQPKERSLSTSVCFANATVTILRVGNDGVTNWYEVDCMGLKGWISQAQLAGTQ